MGEYADLRYPTAKLTGPVMKKTGVYKIHYIVIRGTGQCHLVIFIDFSKIFRKYIKFTYSFAKLVGLAYQKTWYL